MLIAKGGRMIHNCGVSGCQIARMIIVNLCLLVVPKYLYFHGQLQWTEIG